MKIHHFLFLIAFTFLACQPDSTDESNPFTPIFDGETFDGWEGNEVFFRVENNAIIAGSLTDTIPQNEFLCTEKSYGDFELKLEARLEGEGENAGVQFWSERIPDHNEVVGYQCDMGSYSERTIWTSLYDESRRRVFLKHPEEETILKTLKPNDWNEMRIKAQGADITFWLNGIETLVYKETVDSIAQNGKVCLQIHSGLPSEASYRGIEIREILP